MSRVQLVAVAVTVALSALDGYDVLSVTFAAPAIATSWGVGKAALGVLLSAGLGGMALGSLILAPFADVVGRRPLVLGSLTLMATGMLLSALATSLNELVAWRVLTGLGIGAMVAVINPLAAEFANAQRRPLALALMTMGYPMGGLVGGVASAALLRLYGWPTLFVTGALAAALLIPVVLLFLPEPLAFLLLRQRTDRLVRVNTLLARCGLESESVLHGVASGGATGYASVLAAAQLGPTLQITAINLMFVMPVYFVLSWMPQMVAGLGFPPSTASLVAAVSNLFGLFGGFTLGSSARRIGLNRLTVMAMVGLGLATIAFGLAPPFLPLLMLASGTCGFFLIAGMSGLYATLAVSFSAEARASGTGFVIGVGRIGSAVAPLVAGWMFAGGLGRAAVAGVFGACAASAGLLLLIRGKAQHRPTAPSMPQENL